MLLADSNGCNKLSVNSERQSLCDHHRELPDMTDSPTRGGSKQEVKWGKMQMSYA